MVEKARQALEDGHSVVIGLQGTNEAQTRQDALTLDKPRQTAVKEDSEEDDSFTEPARTILESMLKKHWSDSPEVRDEALRQLAAVRRGAGETFVDQHKTAS